MTRQAGNTRVFATVGSLILQLSYALPELSLSTLPRYNAVAGPPVRRQDGTISSDLVPDPLGYSVLVNGTYKFYRTYCWQFH